MANVRRRWAAKVDERVDAGPPALKHFNLRMVQSHQLLLPILQRKLRRASGGLISWSRRSELDRANGRAEIGWNLRARKFRTQVFAAPVGLPSSSDS